jgi:DNA (cytosine-5)-methyltransferase 1
MANPGLNHGVQERIMAEIKDGDRPLLLDLFCGIGGAGMGYYKAGFDILGVDHRPMLEYPFPFIRMDAMEFMEQEFQYHDIKAIHASPPCKKFSTLSKSLGYDSHLDLLTPTREWLQSDAVGEGVLWIIENVPGAPMRNAVILCGSMFNLRIERGYLQRHRLFESNIRIVVPGPCNHEGQAIGVYGNGRGGGALRERTASAQEARDLMGIDWARWIGSKCRPSGSQ